MGIIVWMEDVGVFKKKMFDYFMGVVCKLGEKILNGEFVFFSDWILYNFGELLVYGLLKNCMGLIWIKVGYMVGEVIGLEIF